MRIEHAERVLREWASSPGSGQLRFVKTVDGFIRSAGEEVVHKLDELDPEVRDALVLLGKKFGSPKFEVVSVGPELVVDRVYVYRRKA